MNTLIFNTLLNEIDEANNKKNKAKLELLNHLEDHNLKHDKIYSIISKL